MSLSYPRYSNICNSITFDHRFDSSMTSKYAVIVCGLDILNSNCQHITTQMDCNSTDEIIWSNEQLDYWKVHHSITAFTFGNPFICDFWLCGHIIRLDAAMRWCILSIFSFFLNCRITESIVTYVNVIFIDSKFAYRCKRKMNQVL